MKPRSLIWNNFIRKKDGRKVTATCKFCNLTFSPLNQVITRLQKHIIKCKSCPPEVKQQVLEKKSESWKNLSESLDDHLDIEDVSSIPPDCSPNSEESAKSSPAKDFKGNQVSIIIFLI